ncbi:hypothetical protein [Bacillus cereus group sp. BfR-BA-01380]|uniref:hypothetical protein n=1 Tax=Bacillus cereus group sp. BfR-BA-01380 TaxID=2920324 RepID=UPI001F588D4F|nr:hypothetical protein [Bacillus cereus group sp. BfR-BA-01380]
MVESVIQPFITKRAPEDRAREVESLNKDSESGEVDKKDSFLGMTGFNWMA